MIDLHQECSKELTAFQVVPETSAETEGKMKSDVGTWPV